MIDNLKQLYNTYVSSVVGGLVAQTNLAQKYILKMTETTAINATIAMITINGTEANFPGVL